jgi:hypothetical protein
MPAAPDFAGIFILAKNNKFDFIYCASASRAGIDTKDPAIGRR